jgi:hypothetical protein
MSNSQQGISNFQEAWVATSFLTAKKDEMRERKTWFVGSFLTTEGTEYTESAWVAAWGLGFRISLGIWVFGYLGIWVLGYFVILPAWIAALSPHPSFFPNSPLTSSSII